MAGIISEGKTYLHRIRKYIWLSFLIFAAAAVAGFWTTQNYPQEIEAYLKQMEAFFQSMQSSTPWGMFLLILNNNVEAMLLVVLSGIFFGLFSFIFLFSNGFIIGVFAYLYYSQGLLPVFILGILPHGILEIPAMLFSAAIGFWLGRTVVRKLLGKKESLVSELAQGIRFTVLLIIPALVLAAFIESYITPYFISLGQGGAGI